MFEEFWQIYPRRIGDNPKKPARERFDRLVKSGVDPLVIINAVELYRHQMAVQKKIDTPYVPMATTWLNQRRFDDVSRTAPEAKIGDRIGNYWWNGSRWAENER